MLGAYDYGIARAILELHISEMQPQAEKAALLKSLPRTQPALLQRLIGMTASLKRRAPARQVQADPRCVIIYGCACEATECPI